VNNEKLIRKFDKQSKMYEIRRKKLTERAWREKLISCASGRVLEVAVGAGANFHYYPQRIALTAVDFSPDMLNKAKIAAKDYGIEAEFVLSDVESLSFPDNSFDSIVSTLSFCGYDDPMFVLELFNKWCKSEGQILLMEHGVSSNRLVGGFQHLMNPLFRKVVGCNFDRDIIKILHANLEVKNMEHHMLGAVHLVWSAPLK
jgi:ubiquinone/menaquinone biosynthesis C-methylase UbiE